MVLCLLILLVVLCLAVTTANMFFMVMLLVYGLHVLYSLLLSYLHVMALPTLITCSVINHKKLVVGTFLLFFMFAVLVLLVRGRLFSGLVLL